MPTAHLVPTCRLVPIDEVATMLGVSVRHVRRLVSERRIPFVKWGHLLRFDVDEILQWIADARVPAHQTGLAPTPLDRVARSGVPRQSRRTCASTVSPG